MRKFLALAFIFLSLNVSFASVPVIAPTINATTIFISVGKTGEKISLLELSRIKVKDFELLRCQKMKFFDKLSFKVAQKKLRDNINRNGTFDNRKLIKLFSIIKEGKGGGVGGFALGSLLGPIGILIAYLIKDSNKKNRVKWAWIGLIAFIPMWTLIYILAMLMFG